MANESKPPFGGAFRLNNLLLLLLSIFAVLSATTPPSRVLAAIALALTATRTFIHGTIAVYCAFRVLVRGESIDTETGKWVPRAKDPETKLSAEEQQAIDNLVERVREIQRKVEEQIANTDVLRNSPTETFEGPRAIDTTRFTKH